MREAERLEQRRGSADAHDRSRDVGSHLQQQAVDRRLLGEVADHDRLDRLGHGPVDLGAVVVADGRRDAGVREQAIGIDCPLVPGQVMHHLADVLGDGRQILADGPALDLLDARLGVAAPGGWAQHRPAQHVCGDLLGFVDLGADRSVWVVLDGVVAAAHRHHGPVGARQHKGLGLDLVLDDTRHPQLLGLDIRPVAVDVLPHLVHELQLCGRQRGQDRVDLVLGPAVAIHDALAVLGVAPIERDGQSTGARKAVVDRIDVLLVAAQTAWQLVHGGEDFGQRHRGLLEPDIFLRAALVHGPNQRAEPWASGFATVHLSDQAVELSVVCPGALEEAHDAAVGLKLDRLRLAAIGTDAVSPLLHDGVELALVLGRQQLGLEPAQVLDVLDAVDQLNELVVGHLLVGLELDVLEQVVWQHRVQADGVLSLDPLGQAGAPVDLSAGGRHAQVHALEQLVDLVEVLGRQLLADAGLVELLCVLDQLGHTGVGLEQGFGCGVVEHLVALGLHRLRGLGCAGGLAPCVARAALGSGVLPRLRPQVSDRRACHDVRAELLGRLDQCVDGDPRAALVGLAGVGAGVEQVVLAAQLGGQAARAGLVVDSLVGGLRDGSLVDQVAVLLEHALVGAFVDDIGLRLRVLNLARHVVDAGVAVLGRDAVEPGVGGHGVCVGLCDRALNGILGQVDRHLINLGGDLGADRLLPLLGLLAQALDHAVAGLHAQRQVTHRPLVQALSGHCVGVHVRHQAGHLVGVGDLLVGGQHAVHDAADVVVQLHRRAGGGSGVLP